MVINYCVQGSVSLTFENVTRREALASMVRMGDFLARPKREGYYVGCSTPEGLASMRAEDAHVLEFSLTQVGRGVVTKPKLLVAYDSLAEIKVGSVDVPDLDDVGEFFSKSRQPTFRIKAFLRQATGDGEQDQLRGLMEVATLERDGSQPTLRIASSSFEIDFPEGTVEALIGSMDLAGESYELRASRVVH